MYRLIDLWKILCGLVLCEFATMHFGKSSSSSAASANTTNNIDKRLVVSEGTGLSFDNSSQNSISILDGGAINNAFSFALENSKSVAELSAFQTNTAKEVQLGLMDLQKLGGEMQYKTFQDAVGFAKSSTDTAAAAYSTAAEINTGSRFLVMGGLVIAGIVAFAALKR